MLTALELENFKAFGKRTRIELAPITLVFGQNSAGKSSILQALNLLKQTRESREHGALLLPRAEGGFSDLGSFQELLFDHDISRSLSIRVDMSMRRGRIVSPRRFLNTLSHNNLSVGYEVSFRQRMNDKEICMDQLSLYLGNEKPAALRFEPIELDSEEKRNFRTQLFYLRTRRPIRSAEIRAAKCVSVTNDHEFWRPLYEIFKKNNLEIVRALKMNADHNYGVATDEDKQAAAFVRAIEFYSRDFLLPEFVERMSLAQAGVLIALDGFMATPLQSNKLREFPEFGLERPLILPRVREFFTADAGTLASDVARLLDDELEQLFPMGPFRRPAQRWYVFTGSSPQDVGYRGHLLPDLLFRQPELVQKTNEWLDRLQVGYHINIRPIGGSQDLFELRLLDRKRGVPVDVGLTDVGFGLSQLLPFIVQSLAAQGQTLTIEQPEVHVHPQLQADLGDLLIAAIQPPYNHQFIIETHSEHLILRLLRRVREASSDSLPEGYLGLRPDQLSVIYVERGSSGSTAHRIRIDDIGEFVDNWPHGFFEERVRELF